MSYSSILNQHYVEVRRKLYKPANAVKPKSIQIPPEPAKQSRPPTAVVTVKEYRPHHIKIDRILLEVAKRYDIAPFEITGSGKTIAIIHARWLAIYLILKHLPWMGIGRLARRLHKDHSTVAHAKKRIGASLNRPDLMKIIQDVEEALNVGINHPPAVPAVNEQPVAVGPPQPNHQGLPQPAIHEMAESGVERVDAAKTE